MLEAGEPGTRRAVRETGVRRLDPGGGEKLAREGDDDSKAQGVTVIVWKASNPTPAVKPAPSLAESSLRTPGGASAGVT